MVQPKLLQFVTRIASICSHMRYADQGKQQSGGSSVYMGLFTSIWLLSQKPSPRSQSTFPTLPRLLAS